MRPSSSGRKARTSPFWLASARICSPGDGGKRPEQFPTTLHSPTEFPAMPRCSRASALAHLRASMATVQITAILHTLRLSHAKAPLGRCVCAAKRHACDAEMPAMITTCTSTMASLSYAAWHEPGSLCGDWGEGSCDACVRSTAHSEGSSICCDAHRSAKLCKSW